MFRTIESLETVLGLRWLETDCVSTFKAYFDASGDRGRPGLLAIAGFVSDMKKWGKFEQRWNEILCREGVRQFHMTDYVSSRKEFEGWKDQPERRERFLTDLLECAVRFTNKAFGGAVVLADYEAVNRDFQLAEMAGRPYAMCAHYCIRMVRQWQKKNDVKRVEFAFEFGDTDQRELVKRCKADGVELAFLTKNEVFFQAADLVAWRTRSAFEKILEPGLTEETFSKNYAGFSEAWNGPHAAFFGDVQSLTAYCITEGIPERK